MNLLSIPLDVEVDSSGNIYVADSDNHRVVLWTVGATSGTVVAGTGRYFARFFLVFNLSERSSLNKMHALFCESNVN